MVHPELCGFLKRKCTFVMDRGFDADVFYHYFLKENEGKDDFIVRLAGQERECFYLKEDSEKLKKLQHSEKERFA